MLTPDICSSIPGKPLIHYGAGLGAETGELFLGDQALPSPMHQPEDR
jgi:hypothetical protein